MLRTARSRSLAMLLRSTAAAAALAASAGLATAAPLPEVVLWVQAGPEADALKATASAYTAKTTNPVRVDVQGRAGWRAKYETALAAGSKAVDGVLHITQQLPSLAAGGLLMPIDDAVVNAADYKVGDIPAVVQNEMKMDGKWYMMPTDITVETYVYRSDLIPTPPKTWADLRTTAQKFTQATTPGAPTKYGFAYSAGPGNVLPSWRGVMGAYGGQLIDDKGCVRVDSPEAIASWKFYLDLKNVDKVTPPDINAWDYPEILVGLQTGTLAQASFFSSGMPVLSDCAQSPNICKTIALLPQPEGPKGSRTRINPLGIMVNAATDKKESMMAFLKWATGPEGSVVYTKAGGSSPRASVLSDPELVKERPWYPAMVKAMENGMPTIRHARAREIAETFDRYAQQAVAGSTTPEESIKLAAAELRKLLGNEAACK
jgi:multiple sugar transport system substrate-binding protein